VIKAPQALACAVNRNRRIYFRDNWINRKSAGMEAEGRRLDNSGILSTSGKIGDIITQADIFLVKLYGYDRAVLRGHTKRVVAVVGVIRVIILPLVPEIDFPDLEHGENILHLIDLALPGLDELARKRDLPPLPVDKRVQNSLGFRINSQEPALTIHAGLQIPGGIHRHKQGLYLRALLGKLGLGYQSAEDK
jgi:hypothetical protein